MASMFMRIDGITNMKGVATLEKIGGKEGFFAIDAMSWASDRSIGINIGNSNNSDSGAISLSPVMINRAADGASPYLTTFLFAPGAQGQKIEIVFTKPNRDGEGMDPYLIVTLEGARVSHYAIQGSDGSLPVESFSLTYTTISQVYYHEDTTGVIAKGDTVKFDCPLGKAVSKAQL